MFESLGTPPKRYKCQVERLLDELEPKDREILSEALNDPRWTSTALVTEIRARGLTVGQNHFYAHRKKECACWKTYNQRHA